MDSAEIMRTGLSWLRPWWLLALLPLVAAAAVHWWREGSVGNGWNAVVDPELQPYVLEDQRKRSRASSLALLAVWGLVIVILAGPVFEQKQLPVVEARRAEVVIVDLSRSMNTDDVAPSRIDRARFKLLDILERAGDDRLALVAFAERPYVISPLTDDAETLRAFIPSMNTSLMPAQGSRIDLAIDKGLELLEGAGVTQGHLLLVTDSSPSGNALEAARRLNRQGHRLSVLAVGTDAGAPLRDTDGGFVNNAQGEIVVPGLDVDSLEALADAGGGVVQRMTNDDADIARLQLERENVALQRETLQNVSIVDAFARSTPSATTQSASQQWIERGPWVLPLVALAALLLFRRGVIG